MNNSIGENKICPKCHYTMSYDPYFKAFVCRDCGNKECERDKNDILDDAIKLRLVYNRLQWENDVMKDQLTSYGVSLGESQELTPVIHARWIAESEMDGRMFGECSNCHKIRVLDDYCSACGAKMEED